MMDRIAPWEENLPDDMTPEQGMRLALDRIAWREQGYPDPEGFVGWSNPAGLDYLLDRPSMDTLNLSSLKLDRLPDGLERQKGIDYLFLMGNRIGDIPDAFLDHAEVLSLHLFDNAIANVPAKLFAVRRMEELYLGRNPIRDLAMPDKENLELKFLLLDQCQGMRLSDDFFGKFPNLKSIALNGSGLDRIPQSVFGLKALKQLNLEDNPLKRIPDDIGSLATLTQLDISNCLLETLPKALASATGLRDVMARTTLDSFGLQFSGNPFADKELRKIAKLKNPARTLEALDWAAANGS